MKLNHGSLPEKKRITSVDGISIKKEDSVSGWTMQMQVERRKLKGKQSSQVLDNQEDKGPTSSSALAGHK